MKPTGSFLIPSLLVALIVTIFAAVSCKKTNSSTPTLTLESITTTVALSDSMRALFKFTGSDALSNNNLSWIRHRINDTACTTSTASGGDTTGYQLPAFSAQTGEIYLSLPAQGGLSYGCSQNDTLVFRFYITNAADSALSDTVTTPKIVILYQ